MEIKCSNSDIFYTILFRVSIAKDVASGLLYLHEETANRIIHRDVKPANILLDERWNARVADFGLARLVAEQEQMDLVTNVMGTRGYLAPGRLQTLAIVNQLGECHRTDHQSQFPVNHVLCLPDNFANNALNCANLGDRICVEWAIV